MTSPMLPTEPVLCLCTSSRNIEMYDLNSFTSVGHLSTSTDDHQKIAPISSDDDYSFAVSTSQFGDCHVWIYHPEQPEPIVVDSWCEGKEFRAMDSVCSGNLLVIGEPVGPLFYCRSETGEVVRDIESVGLVKHRILRCVDLPTSRFFVAGKSPTDLDQKSQVVGVEMDPVRTICAFKGHKRFVRALECVQGQFSPSGSLTLFSGSYDQTVRLWNGNGQSNPSQPLLELSLFDCCVSLAYSPEDRCVFVGQGYGVCQIFDLRWPDTAAAEVDVVKTDQTRGKRYWSVLVSAVQSVGNRRVAAVSDTFSVLRVFDSTGKVHVDAEVPEGVPSDMCILGGDGNGNSNAQVRVGVEEEQERVKYPSELLLILGLGMIHVEDATDRDPLIALLWVFHCR